MRNMHGIEHLLAKFSVSDNIWKTSLCFHHCKGDNAPTSWSKACYCTQCWKKRLAYHGKSIRLLLLPLCLSLGYHFWPFKLYNCKFLMLALFQKINTCPLLDMCRFQHLFNWNRPLFICLKSWNNIQSCFYLMQHAGLQWPLQTAGRHMQPRHDPPRQPHGLSGHPGYWKASRTHDQPKIRGWAASTQMTLKVR